MSQLVAELTYFLKGAKYKEKIFYKQNELH